MRLTGNGSDWGVYTYRNGTLGDRQQARVAFKLSQVGTGTVIAVETTDANYYVGLYEEGGAFKLRTRVGGSFSNPTVLMSGVLTNTWYVLELGADHAAGMRATVWKESEGGTRYEARAEAPRSMGWRFHTWVKQGQVWLDGSQGDGYSYKEETPAQSGADSRIVGQHYEYDSVSAQTTKRYYVGGRLVATRTGSAVRYVHADHLGSTTTLTDLSGAVVAKEKYSAFGERRRTSSSLITDQLYTGQRYNVLSSLYHYSDGKSAGRFYDPLLGRFVSADSVTPGIGSQALNPFSYTFNNPLRYNDPNGETPWDVVDVGFWLWSVKDFIEDPSWANAGWLALDTAGLIPIIPSSGWLRRSAQLILHADDLKDLAEGAKRLSRVTTRAVEASDEAAALVLVAAQKAEGRVLREGLEGSIDLAKQAAERSDELLPGLFKYDKAPSLHDYGYAKHHLWPEALGGPKEGWAVYVKQPHHTWEGIQGRLNEYLRAQLNMTQRELERWARGNPTEVLPHLREFYRQEGIDFPY